MKMKKLLALMLALVMVVSLLPGGAVVAFAAPAVTGENAAEGGENAAGDGAYGINGDAKPALRGAPMRGDPYADYTKLDISKGAITITATSVNGKDTDGTDVTTANPENKYYITGTAENASYNITVSGGEHTIVLYNAKLTITDTSAASLAPLALSNNAIVTLKLVGDNTLDNNSQDTSNGAGAIEVPAGCSENWHHPPLFLLCE